MHLMNCPIMPPTDAEKAYFPGKTTGCKMKITIRGNNAAGKKILALGKMDTERRSRACDRNCNKISIFVFTSINYIYLMSMDYANYKKILK